MAITFTGRDLVTQAMKLIGALGQAETPAAADAADALTMANGFIDGLATQRLALPASDRTVFSFITNQSTYSVGPTGDWTMTRPASIDYVNVLGLTATPTFEMNCTALDDQSYAAVVQKSLTAPFPVQYYWNATTPNGTIFFWPTPTDAVNYQAVLYTPTQLTTFATLDTSATLAPGYYRMLLYNVASECFALFARPEVPRVTAIARDALADVKRLNLEPLDLITPIGMGGSGVYSIYGDTNV